ncbi:hypothetical protein MASR2M54_17720 [Aliarcobacter cryaerophilus]
MENCSIFYFYIFNCCYYIQFAKSKGNKADSYIYILPTKNSTVFFKTQKDERVEALEKRENFVKVLGVDSDFIGWVKEESFEKN